MDGEIISRMRDEESALLRKLAAVRDLLAAYGETAASETARIVAARGDTLNSTRRTSPSREKVGIEGFGEYGRRIVATAIYGMLFQTEPMKTRKIVEFLEGLKIDISGENKVNAVGALLGRSTDIVSHGKGGWTVADEARAKEIVSKYAHKENEAPSDKSPEPQKPAGESAPTPSPPWINPLS